MSKSRVKPTELAAPAPAASVPPVVLSTDPSPGPWGVSATADPRVYTVWSGARHAVVAVVKQEEPKASEISRSNAHLIASAPRLRDTLQEVKDYLERLLRDEGVVADDRSFATIYARVNLALELTQPHLPR